MSFRRMIENLLLISPSCRHPTLIMDILRLLCIRSIHSETVWQVTIGNGRHCSNQYSHL